MQHNTFSKHENSENLKEEGLRASEKLNRTLKEFFRLLSPAQEVANQHFSNPKWPVGLLIGMPRSGTTLFTQWIASLNCFSYPTNILTRFACAPYIGALTQNLLFDPEFDHLDQMKDLQCSIQMTSSYGGTQGGLAPNEFTPFLRIYLANDWPGYLSEQQLATSNLAGMRSALASIEAALEKPFFMKGFWFQYNIPEFNNSLAAPFWIYNRRDPIYVMQSMLSGCRKRSNNGQSWFFVKPKEFAQLQDMDLFHQIAGQAFFTEKAITEGLASIPQQHKLVIDYEDFCANPAKIYFDIVQKYAALGCELPTKYDGVSFFECNNNIRLPKEDIHALKDAYMNFESGNIPPSMSGRHL
jgi:hypothetical protein